MSEVIKTYPVRLPNGSVQGDHIGVQVLADGLHLHINGVPFLHTTEDHMPCPTTGKKTHTTRAGDFIVPPGGAVQIALSADGVVTVTKV